MYNSTLWNEHSTLNHLSHQVTKITVSSLTITRVIDILMLYLHVILIRANLTNNFFIHVTGLNEENLLMHLDDLISSDEEIEAILLEHSKIF